MTHNLPALSILQPWAWLIANGHKDIENRTWSTRFRGRFLIHAGKKFDIDGHTFVKETFSHIRLPENFERGGIVGVARITNCVQQSASPWFFGPYGFVIDQAHALSFQPARGQLGFFRPEVAEDIML
jgi:hypothetical protein